MQKLKRAIRRFFQSFFTKLTKGDIGFLQSNLSKQEQILFYRMSAADQKHSIRTAYKAIELLPQNERTKQKLIAKIALMHDIGKASWPPPIFYRVWGTLLDWVIPPLARLLAKKGNKQKASKLCKTLFIKKEHPAIGVELLKELGWGDNPLQTISCHHEKKNKDVPLELDILQKADDEN